MKTHGVGNGPVSTGWNPDLKKSKSQILRVFVPIKPLRILRPPGNSATLKHELSVIPPGVHLECIYSLFIIYTSDTIPRDPGSPNLRMAVEPKYYAFRR